ncbi:cdc42 effector protein 3-like [Siniperca chuatsi]|uniref:cdc42 effector protein 3-like n=1 Tax=Siniperca chuatsi TaxID=119488 RepID=UPI001CE1F7FD|nr:cdc42 effector protein 3-like [Siniperca chuatsi]XP_044021505.1 cdc42 effector protein 3-like [Siniperca chuatsi]XP_044021506.1 cdc42 effector protein 3-like [Siniperca chuatsi]XP_044021507.1 cdc42 effector protein 3-like [Siniperca chuatsi]XP_044021508.1 cdc42 effector protein 3-like [Siniperca chuatsi]XP_044021509.1 cdc42 effector protein 3-like [Siniperca chuatsi]
MPLRTSLYRKPSSGRWPGRSSKRREVLSVNMISLPLADFRHISHIGNDAHTDSFGDLSFLKMGHNLLLQSSQSEHNLFLACSPPPKPPRLNLDEAKGSESPDWHVGHQHNASQKRQKCHSLPLLDSEEGDGEMEKEDGYQRGNNVASSQTHSPRQGSLSSDKDGDSTDTCHKIAGQQKDEDSGFSFSLDLGPSILNDVLQVMDKLHN